MFKFIRISLISVLLTLACQNQIFAPQEEARKNLIKLCGILKSLSLERLDNTPANSDAFYRAANVCIITINAASCADGADYANTAVDAKEAARRAADVYAENAGVTEEAKEEAFNAAVNARYAADAARQAEADAAKYAQVAVICAIKTFAIVLDKPEMISICEELKLEDNPEQEQLTNITTQLQAQLPELQAELLELQRQARNKKLLLGAGLLVGVVGICFAAKSWLSKKVKPATRLAKARIQPAARTSR